MVTVLDQKVGELFQVWLPGELAALYITFEKELMDGRFQFSREGTDLPIYIEESVWIGMRTSGTANRITTDSDGTPAEREELDPTSLLDPDQPSITVRERERRLKALEQLKKARTLRFYVRRYDDAPSIGRGHVSVDRFVARNYQDARKHGFEWRPDAATILRAVDDHGQPGSRPLIAFFDKRGKHDRTERWCADVLEAATEAATLYWSERSIGMNEAIAKFTNLCDLKEKERALRGRPVTDDDPFDRPSEETVRLWIRGAMNWYTWKQKYGQKDADRRFRGRGRSIEATRPLEYVMIDHTRVDAWAVVLDENDQPCLIERPWLTVAIDCYSRMVLGLVLTFEPPSVYSALAVIRHAVRVKEAQFSEYGFHKGATDGWGRPFTVIVDNGWEFTGVSFQTACEAAGIDVIWAPVKIPMFKAYVERLFGTFNSMLWHKMTGGIPLKPHERSLLGIDNSVHAVFTRSRMEDVLWNTIITRYHVEVHSTINAAPADKWRRGIAAHGRPMVARISDLDKVVGASKNCQLSAEGIFYNGYRFHDPVTTTSLLNALASTARERGQRGGKTSSRTAQVTVASDPSDLSKVYVWDDTRKTAVMLPNWDSEFSAGMTWYMGKKVREFAKARNLAFHTPSERAAARVAHTAYIRDALPGAKFADRRKLARELDPAPALVPGEIVETIDMNRPYDDYAVPHDIAAEKTTEEREATQGTRRGGKQATEKAARTRASNKAKASAQDAVDPLPPTDEGDNEAGGGHSVDTTSLLDRLRAQLDKPENGETEK